MKCRVPGGDDRNMHVRTRKRQRKDSSFGLEQMPLATFSGARNRRFYPSLVGVRTQQTRPEAVL
jgi:hypothetical protein